MDTLANKRLRILIDNNDRPKYVIDADATRGAMSLVARSLEKIEWMVHDRKKGKQFWIQFVTINPDGSKQPSGSPFSDVAWQGGRRQSVDGRLDGTIDPDAPDVIYSYSVEYSGNLLDPAIIIDK
jgi:hypothetical protein